MKKLNAEGLSIPTYVRLVMSVPDIMYEILPYMMKLYDSIQ